MADLTLEAALENFRFYTADENREIGTFEFSIEITASQIATFKSWITTLWQSPSFRLKLAELVAQGPIYVSGADFSKIGKRADAAADGRLISISFSDIGKAAYINSKGEVIASRPELVVAHELIHLGADRNSSGLTDPDELSNDELNRLPDFDYDGPAVDFQNKVSREITNFGENSTRVSYYSGFFFDKRRSIASYYLNIGQKLTLNPINPGEVRSVDIVRFGNAGSFLGLFTTDVADKIDTSNRQDSSRDLLMGFGNNDTLLSGAGNDHLWGGEGNDFLDAGEDNDIVHGEDGYDTIIGGKGNDVIDGGHSVGLLSGFIDLQIDTLTYKYLTAGVTFFALGANSDSDRPGTVVVSKRGNGLGQDTVDEVEMFVGTAFADSLDLGAETNFEAFSDEKVIFDLGSHNSSGSVVDTIHAGDFGRALTFDLSNPGAQFVKDKDSGEQISVRGADAVVGTAFSDTIIANNRGNALIGGGGGDYIFGGTGNDRLVGGYSDGNGNYTDDGAVDFIKSSGGVDSIYFSDRDKITDANLLNRSSALYYTTGAPRNSRMAAMSLLLPVGETEGTAHLLTGGENESPPTNPCDAPTSGGASSEQDGEYVGADGARYTLSAGSLTIEYEGGTVFLDGFRNGNAGINLRESRPNVATATCRRDPLIIDLDGDRNVVRELFDSTAYFDLDNDGFRERVAWSLGGDGFVVRDLNGNGAIDNGTELFGTGRSELVAGTYQRSGTEGFAELATLDSNADGRIDAADVGFETLRVWIDANGDALTDTGELKTLAELGITSISLTTVASDDLDCGCDGTEVTFKSDVTFADGSTRSVYDAYLSIDQYDTRETDRGVDVPADFADLPFLIGSGNLSHLDVAMARDPALEAMIREFAALGVGQVGEISGRVEAILLRWTGADAVAADSRGANINARWLTAIEKISGSEFVQARIGANPRGDAGSILINEWHAIVSRTTAALLGQTALGAQLMPGLSFEAAAFFTASEGTTLQSVLASLAAQAPTARQDALQYWQAATRALSRYDQQLGFTKVDLAVALTPLLQASNVPLTGAELLDARFAGAASAMDYSPQASGTLFHVIGDGTERLVGSGAQDIYLIGAGTGSVSLAAQANSTDELWLIDTLRSDLAAQLTVSAANTAVDAEFLLSLNTSAGDAIRLTSNLSTSGFNTPVQTIQFADGERVSVSDLLASQTLAFGASGQVQFGKSDSSVDLVGTAAADLLVGFGQNDRYLVGPGRGSDYVRDVSSSLHDRVVVSTTLSDVRFAASGISGRDLTMTFLSTGEEVTVVGQLGAPGSEVDFFEFSNGLTLSAANVRALVTTGTPGNDRLIGTTFNDALDGKGGTDLVLGGRGDDEYRFNLGYGQLSIDDTSAGNSIRFGAGITPASLVLTGDGSDLLISISGTQDSIRLLNARYGESIGQLFFADSTSTTLAALLSQAAAQAGTTANGTIIGTEAAEDITGTAGNDRILGLGGVNNYLSGLAGNDTYVFGGGKDTIAESLSGFDTLEIPAGFKLEDMRMMRTGSTGQLKIWFESSDGNITLRNGFTTTGLPDTSLADDVERIVFADGRFIDLTLGEKTAGTAGDDYLYSFRNTGALITPGAGNDIVNMTLLFQNNVVRYTTNDIGQDIVCLPEISESGSPSNAFSLQLQATPFDSTVVLARSGVDLVVSFTNRSDSITVQDYFNPLQREFFFHGNAMGGISFAGGISFTYATLSAAIAQRTAGDDLLFGRPNLDGGAGNDILIGDDLANNYTFGRGYGHDTIKEQDSITGSFSSTDTQATTGDTLTMTGLNMADVEFLRSPIDPLSIVIRIKETGETLTLDGSPFDDLASLQRIQQLNLANDVQDQNGAHRIERIIFQDGEMSQLAIEQAIADAERTSGNDVLTNFGTYLASLASLTTLQSPTYDGGAGDDTYINAFDRMSIRLNSNSGHDVVRNSGEGLTTIKLALGDLNLADIYTRAETRDGVAYLVIYTNTGSSLAIELPRANTGGASSDNGLRVFATDQTGASTDLRPGLVGNFNTAPTFTNGTAGDDKLWGTTGTDSFNGGAGNDLVFGRGFTDTVEFRFGDGADTLIENRITQQQLQPPPNPPTTTGGYKIAFKGAITPDDIAYEWLEDGSGYVKILVGNQDDSLTVRYDAVWNMSFESTGTTIPFNGTVFAPIAAAAPTPTDGVDHLFMTGQTIDSMAGNDVITSLRSFGTLRFGPGDGHDVFEASRFGWLASTGTSGNNLDNTLFNHTLQFDGINSLSELAFERVGTNLADLRITIIATGETLTIRNQLSETDVPTGTSSTGNFNYQAVLGTFKLADGTTFSWQKIHSLILGAERPVDATITTEANGGTLDGGSGFDTLLGGSGGDTYVFGRGYDEDAIRDSGGEDVMTFGEGIARDELYFSRTGLDGQDLLVEVTGNDRLSATITGQFADNAQGRIEFFELSDGTLISHREVERFILDTNSTSSADTILGFAGDDRIEALGGNDSIMGLGGNDVADGGAGRDQAVFRGKASEYEITTVDGVTTVRDLVSGRDGTDMLRNVEDLVFLGDGSAIQSLVAPNRAPTAGSTSLSGTEDSDLVVARSAITARVADADGDPLSLSVNNAINGKVWIGTDGNIRFRPDANFNGEASFRYTVSDGNGGTASAQASLSIAAVNDAPRIAVSLGDVTFAEDQPVAIAIPETTFSDVDGQSLTRSARLADGGPLPSWLTFTDGQISGQPPAHFHGSLEIEVTASDGLASASDRFVLSIRSVNDAPTIVNELADVAVAPGAQVRILVPLSNFADADGDALNIAIRQANGAELPGWLTYAHGVIEGTAPVNFAEPLSLVIRVDDGQSLATDYFDIQVAQNTAPVLINALPDMATLEDQAIDLALPADSFSDADGDVLTYQAKLLSGGALPSWLAFDGTRFTGTPPGNFTGVIDIEVSASDGQASVSDVFRLTVNPVNDPPVLLEALPNRSSAEDSPFSIALDKSRFADVDGDVLAFTASLADGSALPVWLQFDGATFSGQPPQDFNGSVEIRVTGSDQSSSVSGNFVLTIDPVNDAPAVLAPLADLAALEDTTFSFALPEASFGDVDGDALTYSARLANGAPLPAWLSFDAGSRTFSGTAPLNFNGFVDLRVTASDGTLSASDVFRLTIDPVNDAPALDAALPDQTVRAGDLLDFTIPAETFSDVDGDALALSATLADGTALPAWLQLVNGKLTGTPPADFAGTIAVRISASDSSLAASDVLSLTVLPRNRAPDALDDGVFVTDQSQQLVISAVDLLANDSDPDGDPLTIIAVGGAQHGTVSINANGDVVYMPNGSYVGTDSFSYTLSDGTLVDSASVAVLIDSPFATWTQGTGGNDKLFGNKAMANQIFGGAGNDMIKGGQLDDMLAGGDGDDHLIGLSGNDHFWGGTGNDQINGNDGLDYAHFAGLRPTYSIVTVNGTVTVVDNAPAQDGNDGTDTISSIERLVFKNGETASVISPIVLDLDGRGVTTLSASQSKARYDLDGDGRRDDTSWIGGGEGFLFLDRDGDGTLSGAGELSFIDDLPGARSDLAGLCAFDSNGDGRLAAGDARFASFKVWRDADSDGVVDSGEVLNLEQAGVKAINLTGSAVNAATAFGDVAVVNRGSYERSDGTTMEFIDAALTYFSAAGNRSQRSRSFGRRERLGEPEPREFAAAVSDPALDAAIAALANPEPGNPIAALSSLSDAEAFARYSTVPQPQLAASQRSQELPVMAIAVGSDANATPGWQTAQAGAPDTDRLLGLLRQDMAGFGAMGSIDRQEWKHAQPSYNYELACG